MSDIAMLKKLLEAENSAREFVRIAEEAAHKREQEVIYEMQNEYHEQRELKIREITAEEEKYLLKLEEDQKIRKEAFVEMLETMEISYTAASRESRKILGLV